MEIINCFYKETTTIDYSIQVEKKEDGIVVTCSQFELEKEFFPVKNANEFIEDYSDDYVSYKYEIIKTTKDLQINS